jgi:hypothetical protein
MARNQGARKATVGWLHVDPAKLTWAGCTEILNNLHVLEGEKIALFRECVAYFEDNGEAPQRGVQPRESDFSPPTHTRRFDLAFVEGILEHKRRSEEESAKRKHEGTPSTRAPIRLEDNTFVLVAGSIPFLQTHAGLYFSELGTTTMRGLFLKIGALKELKSTRDLRRNTYYRYDTQDKRFDACNFDAEAELLKLARRQFDDGVAEVLTTEEVQRLIHTKGRTPHLD